MPLDQVDVDAKPQEKEMSFLDHVEELRWHIIRACSSIFVFAIGAFVIRDFIFHTVIFGPKRDDFLFYRAACALSDKLGMGDALCMLPPEFDFVTPDFGENFITALKVSIYLGIACSIPFIFWEIWRFIKPGLLPKERKAARGFVFVCSSLFFAGVFFGYFIISPIAVNFLMTFEIEGVIPMPALSSYVNYMAMFTLPTGIVFQLPIVVYFLSKVGIITPDFMRKYRRHAFVVILILAAMITPPDVITQLLLGIPLYFLYEVSIHVSKRVHKKKEKEAA